MKSFAHPNASGFQRPQPLRPIQSSQPVSFAAPESGSGPFSLLSRKQSIREESASRKTKVTKGFPKWKMIKIHTSVSLTARDLMVRSAFIGINAEQLRQDCPSSVQDLKLCALNPDILRIRTNGRSLD